MVLGKQSQEFPKKLGTLEINYFLPKLLVTYGMCSVHKGETLFCQVCKFQKSTKNVGVKVDVQRRPQGLENIQDN